ncbi:MAG: hypothetical protein KAI47_02175 [Deltaproteobacteria bacterium]|nr:hypothetical protein [Deltaproteobacteria bacterium]
MPTLDTLEAACATLADRMGEPLQWEWDARFSAALVVIKEAQKTDALAALDAVLPQRFETSTIAGASPETRELANAWGGLRAGQSLSMLTVEDAVLVGVWWPWGSGTTFSLRVTITGLDGAELLKHAFHL